MTMKHDPDYMRKISIMRKNLIRIVKAKGYDRLTSQIWSDFLCLTVLYVKGIVYKQKDLPYSELKRQMKRVITGRGVSWALWHYDMPRLTLAERLFIFFMKTECYPAIYLAVRLYFR